MFYDTMFYHIKVTNKCDKACQYCFDDKNVRGRVSLDDFKALVDKSTGFEKLHFTFMGGEPLLLNPIEIEAMFAYAVKVGAERLQKIEFKMITNGSKLNAVWIDMFKRFGVYLVVSYDGKDQDKSEYEQIKKYAADISTINFTMNKDNFHLLSDTIIDMDALGIPYFDGYIDIFSNDDMKQGYVFALESAMTMMDKTKRQIKWFLHQDLKRYARSGKNQRRNVQLSGVWLNNDFSLRPGGVIMPSVQDSKFTDMSMGNIHDVEHIIDIVFGKTNMQYNKDYIHYMNRLLPSQQLEKDLRGGYIFDKSTIGMPLAGNWNFMFDIYRELLDFLKE